MSDNTLEEIFLPTYDAFDDIALSSDLSLFNSIVEPIMRSYTSTPAASFRGNENGDATSSSNDVTSSENFSSSTPDITRLSTIRPECLACRRKFTRAADLERHAKKHRPEREFQCTVAGCEYRGSYRKDKLKQHVKNRHPEMSLV